MQIRGRKLAREAVRLMDDQGIRGALKEDKAMDEERDESSLLFPAGAWGWLQAGAALEGTQKKKKKKKIRIC